MSKIILEGKYPDENTITCSECGCIFQYYNSEVITEITTPYEEDFLGGFGVYKHIHCPNCDNDCEIYCEFTENKSIITEIKEWICEKFNKVGG